MKSNKNSFWNIIKHHQIEKNMLRKMICAVKCDFEYRLYICAF